MSYVFIGRTERSEFTKGPWSVVRGENSLGNPLVSVVAADGTVIADNEPYYPEELLEENAHLIAAATDMYEALEKAEALFRKGLLNASAEEIDEVRDLRKAALAKARGE